MSTPAADEFDELAGPAMPAHFYFHVPFCRSKCAYCDFNSVTLRDSEVTHAVFSTLKAEMQRWSLSSLPGVVETVYVGGGTPSLHADAVGRLLADTIGELAMRNDAEITVEANPDSLDGSGLTALLEGGANRLSVGVQAFDDGVLGVLGRAHSAKQARGALALVREAGVDLAVDLICGVPGQTMASWAESIEETLDAGACHVSVYPLAVEPGTPLGAAVAAGAVAQPDPDLAADMMLLAEDRFRRSGIERYEVANFARAGHESRHNSAYWTGRPYAGIGPGAHGMLQPEVSQTMGLGTDVSAFEHVARVRYSSPADIEGWLMGTTYAVETLSRGEALREDVMLGLRLVAGVTDDLVAAAGLEAVLAQLRGEGLVEHVGRRWRTTMRGWLLGNEVFGRIWAGE